MRTALGIDIGGTHLRGAIVDAQGNIRNSVRHSLSERDPESLINHIAQVHQELGVTEAQPIGIGLAAQLWIETGVVAVAPNLHWFDVPFGEMLRARFKQSTRLVNDLNAITVGETIKGAGEGMRDVMCVFVGTGVGMGAVVQGQVIEGADGLATELGHIKVGSVKTGRQCGCGERGCLEAYTSGRHLPDMLLAKVAEGLESPFVSSAHGDPKQLNAANIEAAALQGDPAAKALWHEVCDHLSSCIGTAITLFNPRVLVLGGGVLTRAPSLK
jgi:glucokinase